MFLKTPLKFPSLRSASVQVCEGGGGIEGKGFRVEGDSERIGEEG